MKRQRDDMLVQALNTIFPDFKAQLDLARHQSEKELMMAIRKVQQLALQLGDDTPVAPEPGISGTPARAKTAGPLAQEFSSRLEKMHQQEQSLKEDSREVEGTFNNLRKIADELVQIGEQNNALAINTYHMLHEQNEKDGSVLDEETRRIPSKMIVRSIQTLRVAEDLNTQLGLAHQGLSAIFSLIQDMLNSQNEMAAFVEKVTRDLDGTMQASAQHSPCSGIDLQAIRRELDTLSQSFVHQARAGQIMSAVSSSMDDFVGRINTAVQDGDGAIDEKLDLDALRGMLEANYVTATQKKRRQDAS